MSEQRKYGSCLENKKLGVGFKFLSYRVFGGFLGGTEGVRDRFAVGGRRADTVISYFRSFLFSRQDPYKFEGASPDQCTGKFQHGTLAGLLQLDDP